MRFFKFVICCRQSVQPAEVPATTGRREETRALVPLPCAEGSTFTRRNHRQKSGRNSVTWQPSLVAISEDGVLCGAAPKGDRTVGSAKNNAGKAGSRAKIRSHEDKDRFGHGTVPMVHPAFAPTPFLF